LILQGFVHKDNAVDIHPASPQRCGHGGCAPAKESPLTLYIRVPEGGFLPVFQENLDFFRNEVARNPAKRGISGLSTVSTGCTFHRLWIFSSGDYGNFRQNLRRFHSFSTSLAVDNFPALSALENGE